MPRSVARLEFAPATALRRGLAPFVTRAGLDAVIRGLTASGRPFRPSDGCDGLAGLTAAFGPERKLAQSPPVRPVSVAGVRAVIVGAEPEALEPRRPPFLANFTRDNGLVPEFHAGTLKHPRSLVPPSRAVATGPREPA